MSISTKTKQTQCQRLLAYLRKNRRGITTMEAFEHLRITCVHKRIAEIEGCEEHWITREKGPSGMVRIDRIKEKTVSGATVTRYKLAKS